MAAARGSGAAHMPPLPIFLFFFIVFCMVVCMSLNCSSSSMTSCGWWPEPRAMRRMREGASIFVSSSSPVLGEG